MDFSNLAKGRYRSRSALTESERRDKRNESVKRWQRENPDKVKASAKRWRENNPEKVKEQQRRYEHNRIQRVEAETGASSTKSRRWIASEDRLLLKEGLSIEEIAKQLNRTWWSVAQRRSQINLGKTKPAPEVIPPRKEKPAKKGPRGNPNHPMFLLRIVLDVSQGAFGKLIGKDRFSINNIESEKIKMLPSMFLRIRLELGAVWQGGNRRWVLDQAICNLLGFSEVPEFSKEWYAWFIERKRLGVPLEEAITAKGWMHAEIEKIPEGKLLQFSQRFMASIEESGLSG